jgi:peptide deformylase
MANTSKLRQRAKGLKYRQMIRTFDDPILSIKCANVERGDDLSWLSQLGHICQAFPNGVGLAAPQAGIAKRAVYIFNGRKDGYFMVNPVIKERSEQTVKGEEGCLSYPGVKADVYRHVWVIVEYYTHDWEKVTRKVDGFEAVIIQHELDHLDGVCRVAPKPETPTWAKRQDFMNPTEAQKWAKTIVQDIKDGFDDHA